MTTNQIAYWSLQETKRANAVREEETERSNRTREAETERANKRGEEIRYDELLEKTNHNNETRLLQLEKGLTEMHLNKAKAQEATAKATKNLVDAATAGWKIGTDLVDAIIPG